MDKDKLRAYLDKAIIYVDMPFNATCIDVDVLTNQNIDSYGKE